MKTKRKRSPHKPAAVSDSDPTESKLLGLEARSIALKEQTGLLAQSNREFGYLRDGLSALIELMRGFEPIVTEQMHATRRQTERAVLSRAVAHLVTAIAIDDRCASSDDVDNAVRLLRAVLEDDPRIAKGDKI